MGAASEFKHSLRSAALGALAMICAMLSMAGLACAQPTTPACSAPNELVRVAQPLNRTALHLATDRRLKIVALGSSSTAGAGASGPAQSYPARLEAELRARLPGVAITVVNRGVNGEDAAEMLARLNEDVIAERPDLVLWQVGTNAVLRNFDLTGEAPLIRAGVDRLKASGADVVLMDSQYAPAVLEKADNQVMLDLLELIAGERSTGIFHRFAIMRHWQQVEHIAFADFVADDGLHMNDWSYGCVAKLLASAIVDGAVRPSLIASNEPRSGS
jgi:lysophospholipase L1-like esterase